MIHKDPNEIIDNYVIHDDKGELPDIPVTVYAKELSCFTCLDNDKCNCAWSGYNITGDCLAEK